MKDWHACVFNPTLLWPLWPKQKNECARGINPIKTMEEVHKKLFHDVFEEKEPPDTTTGDASPWSILARFNGRRKTITFDACFLTEERNYSAYHSESHRS